jgi:membrane-associated phospholipid phosphatase
MKLLLSCWDKIQGRWAPLGAACWVLAALGSTLWSLPAPRCAADGLLGAAAVSRQAACLIRTSAGALMVRDVWSRRLSLPGGSRRAGESEQESLRRLLQEQAGIDVQVGPALGADPLGLTLYSCTALTPLRRQKRQMDLPAQVRQQTEQLLEVDPQALPADRWRDRRLAPRWAALCRLGMAQAPAEPQVNLGAPSTEPWLMHLELGGNQFLQAHAGPLADRLLRLASDFGHIRTMYLVALAVWALGGPGLAVELLFACFCACLINCIAKDLCMLPRPCYLMPALQLDGASNFGFPSGHTMLCSTLFGTLARRSRSPYAWPICIGMALACGVGRVYLGVHFIHDVLGAYVLSAGLLWAHAQACTLYPDRWVPLRIWGICGAVLGCVACSVSVSPAALLFIASFAGLWLSLLVLPIPARRPLSRRPSWQWAEAALQLGWGFGAYWVCQNWAGSLQPESGSPLACGLVLALRFGLTGALLPTLGWVRLRRRTPCLPSPGKID